MLTLRLFGLAAVIGVAVAIVLLLAGPGCFPKEKTAYDLLQEEPGWTLVSGGVFSDGGSMALSFIGVTGHIIHLWAEAPSISPSTKRRLFLMRTYGDPAAVEILPSSAEEQQVLALLASCSRGVKVDVPESSVQPFAKMLQDRDYSFPTLRANPEDNAPLP